MKLQRARTRGAAGAGRGAGGTARRLLAAQAALTGGLALALLAWLYPSLMREVRIWRMTGGFRAGHRYP